MGNTDKMVRQIAYSLCIGINQLIDKGYSETPNIIADKVFNGDLVEYIITKYKNEKIPEFNFTKPREESLPKFIELLKTYEPLATSWNKYYGISNNGLFVASSVLTNILFEEN